MIRIVAFAFVGAILGTLLARASRRASRRSPRWPWAAAAGRFDAAAPHPEAPEVRRRGVGSPLHRRDRPRHPAPRIAQTRRGAQHATGGCGQHTLSETTCSRSSGPKTRCCSSSSGESPVTSRTPPHCSSGSFQARATRKPRSRLKAGPLAGAPSRPRRTRTSTRSRPSEYRELAITLDAAVEAVRDAAELAANLHASGAPAGVRALAERLSAAAVVIEAMLPHVSRAPAEVLRRCAGVRRLIAEGDTIYYDGVGALFLGAPDAVEVLRWKDIYGTLRHALQCCGRSAGVLAQVTRSNS
jgi:hypothetical protein